MSTEPYKKTHLGRKSSLL